MLLNLLSPLQQADEARSCDHLIRDILLLDEVALFDSILNLLRFAPSRGA